MGTYLLLFLRFLYTLYIAVDANFKLKGKQRRLNDVELMGGMGAFVEEENYQRHLAEYVSQPEVRDRLSSQRVAYPLTRQPLQINTCESQHDALVRAATRSSPGYAVSGVVAVICTRHCLVRRNGAGDLQKGEK